MTQTTDRHPRRTQTQERQPASPSNVEQQLNESPTKRTALARIQEAVPTSKMAQYRAHGYDDIRLAMVWDQVARDLTLTEFLYFMERATVTGLDPLRGQMFAIKRRDRNGPGGFKVTHQVSIDGYRAQATKSGAYAGSDAPEFSEPTDWKGKPAHEVCRVTVYRIVQGVRVAFVGECRLSEYYPGDSQQGAMWQKHPHNQLAKCTEAQALRKAFPVELGGLAAEGDPGNDDLFAQFADSLMERTAGKNDDEPQYIEVPDRNTGEMTKVRAADEYVRMYGDDDDQPLDASFRAVDDERSVQPTAPIDDDGPAPWDEPAVSPKVQARMDKGLCLDPECVEADAQMPAAEGTNPPRCLHHVG